jgi:hypothetical protein
MPDQIVITEKFSQAKDVLIATSAMKRFAGSLARQKGIKPPPYYKTSITICRKFLNEARLQIGKPSTDVVRQEDRAGERRRHSRGGQGQLGCYVRVDRHEPKREAPPAQSPDRL